MPAVRVIAPIACSFAKLHRLNSERAVVRIGIDGHVLTGKHQGTKTTLTNLLKAMAVANGRHKVVVFSNDPEEARLAVGEAGYAYRALVSHSPIRRLLREFPLLFRKEAIDIGVFNYISPLPGRSVVFIHDLLPFTHGKYFPIGFRLRAMLFFALSMMSAWRIIAVSEYTAASIRNCFPWLSQKLRVARNGPSFPERVYFEPRTPSPERYVLAVGRMEQRKNIALLAEAFVRGAPADVSLVCVGSRDLGYDYRLPDDPRIRVVTGLDDERLIELYRGADLFVYPSSAEGFGLPLLDATLFGLPVLSSDRTVLPEVGGHLVEYFNPDEPGARNWLSARIARHFAGDAVQAPSLADRLEQAARFSWNKAAMELVAVLEEATR